MSIITLEKMEFHAFHGCLEHEKTIGNIFEVSVIMYFDTSEAGETDNLEDTVNYQQVYDIVKSEMEITSNLIENVAWRIIKALKSHFPDVINWDLILAKRNPPLGGKAEKVCVQLSI